MTENSTSSSPSPSPSTPYRVLARKYRPKHFQDLIGQQAMVQTLDNAYKNKRLAHAFMLTGVRGVGKTTTARIIALALNCEQPGIDGQYAMSPCTQCGSCTSILSDHHVDVIEMDAATRTGVDDIREIIDGVKYAPVSSQYKIYIIDEVHMLSKAAFNALLKTLEEPPAHVKFIFATTEIRKVPLTILSRCQRFDLKRVDVPTLKSYFNTICEKESVSCEDEALFLISRAADGSVRDGLSLLDQAISMSNGQVTQEAVKTMLGLSDKNQLADLYRAILEGQSAAVIEKFIAMHKTGGDPLQIIQDLLDLTHSLSRLKVCGDQGEITHDIPNWCIEFFRQVSGQIHIPNLTKIWQILIKGLGEFELSSYPQFTAEMILIRLTHAAQLPDPAELLKNFHSQDLTPTNAPLPNSTSSKNTSTTQLIQTEQVIPETVLSPDMGSQPPILNSYRELVDLFKSNNELILHGLLYTVVKPIKFEQGHIEIEKTHYLSSTQINQISQCLRHWTQRSWIISFAQGQNCLSLQEEDQQAQRQEEQRLMELPVIKEVVKTFPSARIISIQTKTK